MPAAREQRDKQGAWQQAGGWNSSILHAGISVKACCSFHQATNGGKERVFPVVSRLTPASRLCWMLRQWSLVTAAINQVLVDIAIVTPRVLQAAIAGYVNPSSSVMCRAGICPHTLCIART